MGLLSEEYTIPFIGNRYCGPVALAYVMRASPDDAARLLRDISGRRFITGTSRELMLMAITKLGMSYEVAMPEDVRNIPIPLRKKLRLNPTLSVWLEQFSPEPWQEYVINITGHYIVIHGERYFDNQCHLGKPLRKCPYLKRRVVIAWLIGKENV